MYAPGTGSSANTGSSHRKVCDRHKYHGHTLFCFVFSSTSTPFAASHWLNQPEAGGLMTKDRGLQVDTQGEWEGSMVD